MAVFECRYPEMVFFVNGEARKFSGGRYVTEDKDEIEQLSKMADVVRVDDAKEAKEKDAEEQPKKGRKSSK